jgi:hypothetical protein
MRSWRDAPKGGCGHRKIQGDALTYALARQKRAVPKTPNSMKSAQVQKCLDKAAYFERMASIVSDRDAKLQFAEVAKQWRHLAEQIEELELELAAPQAKRPPGAP